MNLLGLDQAQRAPFARITAGLIHEKGIDAKEIFLNVLESDQATEMNYWMAKVLIQEHFISPQLIVAEDAQGEAVKVLHAACLMKNMGMVAAILESNGFQGGVEDKEFQLAALIASKNEDEGITSLLMKYAQEMGNLDAFMRELHGEKLN